MPGNYPSELKTARQTARLTQEQAAEAAAVSLESYKAYEYGGRLPPRETAARLCEAFGAPWLGVVYLREMAEPLGVLSEDIQMQSLPTAVITLINRVFTFADRHRDRQLLAIAEDGIISADEEPVFRAIAAELDGIIGAALAVKFPREGIKKDPPREAPRSGSRSKDLRHSNDHKTYYSTFVRKRKPEFVTGEGVPTP